MEDPPPGYRTRAGRRAPAPRRNIAVFREPPAEGAPPTEWSVRVADAAALLAEAGVRGAAARDVGAGEHFYTSLNFDIGEGEPRQQPRHLLSRFHLARIEHAFVVYYRTRGGERRCDRLAGEIVDVSLGHPDDEAHRAVAAELGGGAHPYHADYPILSVDPALVRLRSYTPRAFLPRPPHDDPPPRRALLGGAHRVEAGCPLRELPRRGGRGRGRGRRRAARAARRRARPRRRRGRRRGRRAARQRRRRGGRLLRPRARRAPGDAAARAETAAYRDALLAHLDELVEVLEEGDAAPALPPLAHIDARHLEHAGEQYYL